MQRYKARRNVPLSILFNAHVGAFTKKKEGQIRGLIVNCPRCIKFDQPVTRRAKLSSKLG